MKIGFLNSNYFPTRGGGAELSTQILAESVTRHGHQATVLTMSNKPGIYEEREVNGIPVTYLPHKNLYSPPARPNNPLVRVAWQFIDSYNPMMGAAVLRWLRREKPDLVHTNVLGGFSVSAWDATRRFRVPVVHTLREYYLQCRLMARHRKGRPCEGICSYCKVCAIPRRNRSQIPDAVVGISHYILDSHLKAGYFQGVPHREVIFNPVGPQGLSLRGEAVSKILRIGYIGRIDTTKGIDFLLREVQLLPKNRFELYVGGAGDTAYTESIRNQDLAVPVHRLGFVEPTDFYQKIDLLIAPSLWEEPFGRVIAEAYCHGLPVLASRKGGMPEIIEEGVTGWTFDPEVNGDFRRKLEEIQPVDCRAMGAACLRKSREFEPDEIGAKYLKLFSKVRELGCSRG